MVIKVQIMSDEEVQRHEKLRRDQDECCDKILCCCGWSIVAIIIINIGTLIIVSATIFE